MRAVTSQLPLLIGLIVSVRRMLLPESPYAEQMASGGAFFCRDLTAPDPTYVLPVASLLMLIANLQLSGLGSRSAVYAPPHGVQSRSAHCRHSHRTTTTTYTITTSISIIITISTSSTSSSTSGGGGGGLILCRLVRSHPILVTCSTTAYGRPSSVLRETIPGCGGT